MEQNARSQRELSLVEVVNLLIDERWRILRFMVVVMALAGAYAFLAEKVYRADALLRINNQEERRPLRQGSINEAGSEYDKLTTVTAEISIIKSRVVLGEVVDKMSLEIVTGKSRLPVFGNLPGALIPFFLPGPLARYTHADERMTVEKFEVPSTWVDRAFMVRAGSSGEFHLLDPDGKVIGSGRAGKPLEIELADGPLHLQVAAMFAHEGAQFEVTRQARITAISRLQEKLQVAEEGRESGLLRIALEGDDRDQVEGIVSAVADSYVNRNKAWRSEEIKETLAYLEKQLPKLKKETQSAEEALKKFRRTNGTIDITQEAERLLNRSVQLETEISLKKRDKDRYTPEHPFMATLDAEIATLKKELAQVDLRIRTLPNVQQRAVDLSRNVDINAELYSRLSRNLQELQLIQSSSSNDVRLIDAGEAFVEPVKPNKVLILVLALVFGAAGGAVWAILRRMWYGMPSSPNDVEALLGMPVYASLPYARKERSLNSPRTPSPNPWLLEQDAPADLAVEGIRSLRTWINTAAFKRTNKALLITGPSPGVGKTFVSMNLASVMAANGRRVLLIDADLRKGNLHHYLGVQGTPGLTELVSGDVPDFSKAIRNVAGKRFLLMPRGAYGGAAELLFHERFARMLEIACERFDEVIVDSPPILAVSDATVIGQHVGSALLVIRQGVNTAAEISEAAKRLRESGVPLRGVVFNGIRTNMSRYFYHDYYGKEVQRDAG